RRHAARASRGRSPALQRPQRRPAPNPCEGERPPTEPSASRRSDAADPLTKPSGKTARGLPSKSELLAFIGSRSGKVGKREIARAFGISGPERVELKHMLRELSAEGHLERRRKKLHRSGHLPSVVLADVIA